MEFTFSDERTAGSISSFLFQKKIAHNMQSFLTERNFLIIKVESDKAILPNCFGGARWNRNIPGRLLKNLCQEPSLGHLS